MSDRPNGVRSQRPRRDPNEIAEHVRNRDRIGDRGAPAQPRQDRDRSTPQGARAATRPTHERTLTEAQARARARATGEAPAPAFLPRGRKRQPQSAGDHRRLADHACCWSARSSCHHSPAGFFRSLAEANPDLMRIGLVSDAVTSVMGDRPDKPAGTDPTMVEFLVEPGESSAEIAQDLVNRGLLTDRLAFTYVLVNEGGLNKLAGRLAHAQSHDVATRDRRGASEPADDYRLNGPGGPARGSADGADRGLSADAAAEQLRSGAVLRCWPRHRPTRSSRSSRG